MDHQKFASCIEACHDCMRACDYCAQACLAEPDAALLAHCIKLDIDCSALCSLAAGAMGRNSAFVDDICALCAAACDMCAAECEQHAMAHCRQCAIACRRCADQCRLMVRSAGAAATAELLRGAH